MRRVMSILFSLCLGVSLMVPAPLFAAASTQEGAQLAAQGSELVEEVPVSPAFRAQRFLDLQQAGTIDLAATLPDATVTPNESYGGVLLKGKHDALAAARIDLGTFDFGDRVAGYLGYDALRERGVSKGVTLQFYLDDADEPFVSLPLKTVYGKQEWKVEGRKSVDISAAGITGAHRIWMGIDAASEKSTELLLRSFTFICTSLPVVSFDLDESQGSIDAMNGSADHSRECYGSMTLTVPQGYTSEYTGEEVQGGTFDLEYIRGRGNSTWSADKKPYKVKLDKKADLFGMGANKHWVLLANRYDNSLLRNKLTYWMGDKLGMEFTPQCVFVDVVMNGDYLGSYYLCEQIRVGDSRVAIDDLEDEPDATEEPAITGGYLLSMDSSGLWDFVDFEDDAVLVNGNVDFATQIGLSGFTSASQSQAPSYINTDHDMSFFVESPEFTGEPNLTQLNYIKDYLNKTEAAIYGSGFKDTAGKGYADYLDVDSAVDYYWMQELAMNGDAYGSGSTYLYKKRYVEGDPTRDGKLYWGPLWDFDYVAWGDLEYGAYSTEGFSWMCPWAYKMMQDPAFAAKMMQRWADIRALLVELTRSGGQLDTWAQQIAVSHYYDHERWGSYGDDWWEYEEGDGQEEERSYADEIEQLRGWITQRMEWVDANLDYMAPEVFTVKYYVDGKLYTTQTYGRDEGIELPMSPSKKGYVFKGWYTKKNAKGERVRGYDTVYSALKLYAAWGKAKKAAKPTGVYFPLKAVGVYLGEGVFKMPCQVLPAGAKATGLKWSSSKKTVAKVGAGGLVTLKAGGTTVITAKYGSKAKASYKLYVVENDEDLMWPWGMKLSKKKLTVKKGKKKHLYLKAPSPKCQIADYEWSSLDPKIASVGKGGLVKAKKPGTTYVMVCYEDNAPLFCKVKVTKAKKAKKKK